MTSEACSACAGRAEICHVCGAGVTLDNREDLGDSPRIHVDTCVDGQCDGCLPPEPPENTMRNEYPNLWAAKPVTYIAKHIAFLLAVPVFAVYIKVLWRLTQWAWELIP